MPDFPVAAHTFDFVRVYLSTRDLAAPGAGTWSAPTIIFDGSGDGTEADTFSAGALGPTDPKSGIIANNAGGRLRFLGNGSPAAPILINVATDGTIPSGDYWDVSQGAFPINGALYIIYQSLGTDYLRIAKSTDDGATWAIQDGANGPSGLLAYDGAVAAVQRVNDLLCVCTPTDGRDTNFAIWEFDPATDTWGPQFADLPIPNFASFSSHYGWTNGLYKFPNDDYIVIYNDSSAGPVLQLWNGAAWGAQKALPSGDYANSLMDPAFDKVHIFTYVTPGNRSSDVVYSLYDHNTDTITASITTISDPGGTSDGVGHCSIQDGMLFVPRDRSLDFDNAVWVATLPVVTFSKELLPIPPEEAGLIFAVAVNPGGTGYLVNDTGTVDGGVVPATYKVTGVHNNAIASESLNAQGLGYAANDTFTVNGGSTLATGKIVSVGALGVVTDWVLLTLGAGYSVAAGVATTRTSGAGAGFTLDILSLFNGVTGLTITSQGAGYSVNASVATTVGGAQPGVGVGLTINILAIEGKEPSCAYMMFPNGYQLTPSGPALTCPIGGGTATVGVPYSAFLIATGGTPPYTYSIVSGALPPGLSLNAATGEISGTPTTAGVYTYTARVTDANGLTADTSPGCTINVSAGTLTATCPPSAHFSVGTPYSAQVGFSGGVPPYTFAIIAGSLPPGVTLNASTGLISGTPTVGGDYSYTVQVTDSLGNTANTASCPLDLCTGVKSELTPPAPVAMAGDICDQSVRSSPKSQL